jgi:hydroxymethylbilane synthase
MSVLRIATRGSDLALWQARHVGDLLAAALGVKTELVPLKTAGDRLTGPLSKQGGKGLFVAEIEAALLDGRADVAVHSAKDLPAATHPDLALAAFPERADPRDALVARAPGTALETLPRGARLGTGSARRTAQLRLLRADLEVVPLRGNVGTRLAKLDGSGLDALVLACAGLDRLGLASRIACRIPPESLLPAAAQGALAVEARGGTPLARDLAAISHPATACCVAAERAFLRELGGDCNVPVAALATLEGGGLRARGLVLSPDGSRDARAEVSDSPDHAERAGAELARRVLAKGGRAILAALRSGAP